MTSSYERISTIGTTMLAAGIVARSPGARGQSAQAWPMTADLRRGCEQGQFSFADLSVAVDFMMGASVAGIRKLGLGVEDPVAYLDESVRMALVGLGSSARQSERGVKFSREYLDGWKMSQTSDGH